MNGHFCRVSFLYFCEYKNVIFVNYVKRFLLCESLYFKYNIKILTIDMNIIGKNAATFETCRVA